MTRAIALATIAAASTIAASPGAARETRVPVRGASLYAREIGQGPPIVVLHGGPDFDSSYFLPELDRLSDSYRLVYYDQRGRGKSADRVQPGDVTLESEMADLDAVRQHFRLDAPALLGHSWGTLLALEYAVRHPDRVSRLILMNPGPASSDDYKHFREERLEQLGPDLDRLRAAAATQAFKDGDPDAVTSYYRIHFKPALARPDDYEKFMTRLHASFTREGVLKARAIEDRLMAETWSRDGYDLAPKLKMLRTPALVIFGDHDLIPARWAATPIARALPDARMVTFAACGHFAYLECPGDVRRAMHAFFAPRR